MADVPDVVVAVASSAGGVVALNCVLPALPVDVPAAVLVVQHLDPPRRSLMPQILGRRTALPVVEAEHGQRLKPGTVDIAPPDRHLLVGRVSLSDSELVHFVPPAADPLFESVASGYRDRAIAVVQFHGTPRAAAGTGDADLVLPLGEIARALVTLVEPGTVG